jgi:hypothetical protein
VSFRKPDGHIFLNINTTLGYFSIENPNYKNNYYKITDDMREKLGKYVNLIELNANK